MKHIAIEAYEISTGDIRQAVSIMWDYPPSAEEIEHQWGLAGYPDSFLVVTSDGTPYAYSHQGGIIMMEGVAM